MVALRSFSVCVLTALLLPVAQATFFSDVPDDAVFAPHITALLERNIVRGNPDGTFRPDATINRAELLTLLYRATERSPADAAASCFKDVVRGSWYEAVVCDATAQGYVSGYPDKTFRPQQSVNRIEALKMLHTVLGFDYPESLSPALGADYEDIDWMAWYAPYVASALLHEILPIAGQEGPLLQPGVALTRGEAAAYIAHALQLPLQTLSSSGSAASSVASASATSSVSVGEVSHTTFPFREEGLFLQRDARVLRFTLQQTTVARVRATVDPGRGKPGLTCRLFRMNGSEGFSSEYYLGYVKGNECTVRATLVAGDYQWEVRPSQENASFVLEGETTIGDGNDGFSEARSIGIGKTLYGIIEEEDVVDWFTFALNRPQTLQVEMAEESGNSCIVYAMNDVDLFGFSGPQCNASYAYPRGTYVIGVQRKDGRSGAQSYDIRLR